MAPSVDDKKTPFRRPSVKPVSRETPKGVEALKKCKCFKKVDKQVRIGAATADIARMVQEDEGELLHLSRTYVTHLIKMYRTNLPPMELMVSSKSPRIARNAQRKVEEGLNELKELEKLFAMQISRIDIDFGNEKKINKLFPTTGREIYVAAKLLKQSSDLKSSLGIYKKQLGQLEITTKAAIAVTERYQDDSLGRVIQSPDSRRKVLGMVQKLMAASVKSVDAVFDTSIIDVDPESVEVEGPDSD